MTRQNIPESGGVSIDKESSNGQRLFLRIGSARAIKNHREGKNAKPATRKALAMTTTYLVGYVVRSTDAALAFVAEASAKVAGVKPLWIPRKKIADAKESDAMGVRIQTAQDGERVGILTALTVDSAWLAKVAA
jgi:hypothetical protein